MEPFQGSPFWSPPSAERLAKFCPRRPCAPSAEAGAHAAAQRRALPAPKSPPACIATAPSSPSIPSHAHTVAGCGGAEKARWKHYISMEESVASMGTYILSVHPRARAAALDLRQEVDSDGWSRRSRCAPPRVLRVMRGGPEHCEIASQVWRCGAPLFLM